MLYFKMCILYFKICILSFKMCILYFRNAYCILNMCTLYFKNDQFSKTLWIKFCQDLATCARITSMTPQLDLFKGQTPRTSLQPHQGAGFGLRTGTSNQKNPNFFPDSWKNNHQQHEAPSLPPAAGALHPHPEQLINRAH